ncbi:hypothetical protein [Hutsoniella sourekii]|uniref:hypothetical protein n=1 Tax=Hutsoniella sourekii TaxID=87650 RepID=UPI0004873A2A|nr:hypothetical protein [Hutsoniella sourekii]
MSIWEEYTLEENLYCFSSYLVRGLITLVRISGYLVRFPFAWIKNIGSTSFLISFMLGGLPILLLLSALPFIFFQEALGPRDDSMEEFIRASNRKGFFLVFVVIGFFSERWVIPQLYKLSAFLYARSGRKV